MGGTGKTPVVAALAEWLLRQHETPAILSRGYGRQRAPEGVVVVSDGQRILAGVDTAGDEPLMLARTLHGAIVVVAEDRSLAGALAERKLGATVHLLDDGFQHLRLARAIDVLVTSRGEIPGGRVIPFGRLREPASAAARADAVVVVDVDLADAQAEGWALGISQAVAARRTLARAEGEARTVFAIAGIGRPEQFFAGLRQAGFAVAGTMAFRDHHRYTHADVRRIARAAQASGAETVVTTMKDLVRLETLETLPFALEPIAMSLTFDGWEVLTATVQEAMTRAREAA